PRRGGARSRSAPGPLAPLHDPPRRSEQQDVIAVIDDPPHEPLAVAIDVAVVALLPDRLYGRRGVLPRLGVRMVQQRLQARQRLLPQPIGQPGEPRAAEVGPTGARSLGRT